MSLAAYAIADGGLDPGAGSPGWTWGRDNCGPHTSNNCTLAECIACCDEQYNNGWETLTWRNHCHTYCASVNWTLWC